VAQPVPERRPIFSGGTNVGIIGIVEDGGEFGADAGDGVSEQQQRNSGWHHRLADPHRAGTDHEQGAKARDPRLAATGGIRDGASTGDISAIIKPAAAVANPHSAWPLAGSGATKLVK